MAVHKGPDEQQRPTPAAIAGKPPIIMPPAMERPAISETVSASICFAPSFFRSSRNCCSSSAVTTSPRVLTRSLASIVSASGAIGSDLL